MHNNKKLYKLSLWLLLVIPSSCQLNEGTPKHSNQIKINLIENNACDLIKELSKNLKFIIDNSNAIIKSNNNTEECILTMMDSLTSRAIKYQDNNYVVALDSLCKASDGSVSEYANEVSKKLFYKNFLKFIEYLFENKNNSCLRSALITEMSMDLSLAQDDENLPQKQQEIKSFADNQIKEYKLTKEKIEYVYTLVKEFNPELVK